MGFFKQFANVNIFKINILDILEGCADFYFSDYNNKKEKVEKVSKYRLNICDKCQINEDGYCDITKQIINITTKKLVKGCGCNLKCKTALLSSKCPADKWLSVE